MSNINLNKGQKISLVKKGQEEGDSLKSLVLGLGWDAKANPKDADFDLDASVIMLKDGKYKGICFYNDKVVLHGAIIHQGDNLTGDGDGDDEKINIDLFKIREDNLADELVVVVNIHEASARKQNFGMVSNAYCRLVDEAKDEELFKYDLQEDGEEDSSVKFVRIYLVNDKWKVEAIGEYSEMDLQELADSSCSK